MTWSGLRGAISIVLALGIIGLGLPHEKLLLALTYGIVLTTNLIQGLSMPVLIKRLKLFSSATSPIVDDEETTE
jgi:monovalent cation/hydrogen antiporter